MSHTWDMGFAPAICSVCCMDMDLFNTQGLVCTGQPMDWPAGYSTNYPTCTCGVCDWEIQNTGHFKCRMCSVPFDLSQLIWLQPKHAAIQLPTFGFAGGLSYALGAGPWTPVDEPPVELNAPKGPPRCRDCQRELSKEMDAYWGRNPYEAEMCRPCRTGKPF